MKIISVIFAFYLSFWSCQSKNDASEFNGWTSHNLNGKVKEIMIKSYKIDSLNGKPVSKKQYGFYDYYRFSPSGDELLYNIIDENDTVRYSGVPIYTDGKITGSTITHIQEKITENWIIKKYLLGFYGGEMECYVDHQLVKKVINTINKKGHQTSMKVFSGDKLIYEKNFEYDTHENLIKTIENGTKTTLFTYIKSDTKNNWTKRRAVTGNEVLVDERSIMYY